MARLPKPVHPYRPRLPDVSDEQPPLSLDPRSLSSETADVEPAEAAAGPVGRGMDERLHMGRALGLGNRVTCMARQTEEAMPAADYLAR